MKKRLDWLKKRMERERGNNQKAGGGGGSEELEGMEKIF